MSAKLILAFLLLFFLSFKPVCAQSYSPVEQKINPGSLTYKVKRLVEKMRDYTYLSIDKKTKYHLSLIDKRVGELKFVVDKKDPNEIEKSSGRLNFEVGVVNELLEESDDKALKEKFKEKMKNLSGYLPELRDKYEAQSSGWLFLQQNLDTANAFSS